MCEVLVIFICTVTTLFVPCASASDLDLTSLTSHVLLLEETVSTFQSHVQILEQKHAATLTIALSELTTVKKDYSLLQTVLVVVKDEMKTNVSSLQSQAQIQEQKQAAVLSSILSELSTLKTDYSTLQTELTTVKDKLKTNEEELNMVKSDLGYCNDNLTLLLTEVSSMKSDITVPLTNLNTTEKEFQTVKYEMRVLTAELERNLTRVQGEVKSLEDKQKVSDTGLQSVKSQIGTFLLQQNSVKSEQQHLMSQVSNAQTDVSHLKTDVSQVKTTSSHNSATLKSVQAKLNQKKPEVYFMVSQQTHSLMIHQSNVVKFNTVKGSVSGSYNTHNGYFTVPVSGTYIFWIRGRLEGKNQHSLVYINSNNGILGYAFGSTGDTQTSGLMSGMVIASLERGDKVYFRDAYGTNYGPYSGFGVKFGSVEMAVGGGYNPQTGYFTVPVSGTYIFWMTGFLVGKHQHSLVFINSNDGKLGSAFGNTGAGASGFMSGLAIATLKRGDSVYFKDAYGTNYMDHSPVLEVHYCMVTDCYVDESIQFGA